MQIEAVMADRFSANAPNGASSSVAKPVRLITLEIGTGKPAARIAATPGRFCEAIVTTNNGSARLTVARQLNSGAVYTGSVRPQCTVSRCNCPLNAAQPVPSNSTPGTA